MKDKHKGAVYGLLMALLFATTANFVKLSAAVPNQALVFIRNFSSLVLILPFVAWQKRPLKISHPFLHVRRTIFALFALYFFFFGIKRVDLVDAIVLRNSIPLLIPLVLLIWKKSRIPTTRLIALSIGYLGIAIILRPTFSTINLGMVACLSSAVFASISLIAIRDLIKVEDPKMVLFVFFFLLSLFSFFPFIFAWQSFDPKLLLYLLLVGICSVLYQLCLTKTYTYLPASKGACFIYFSVVFGGIYGWIFWGDVPDLLTIIGSLLIIIAGVWVLLEKK